MHVWLPESQMRETGAGAKGKRFFRCRDLGEWWTPISEPNVPFLLKPLVLIRVRRKRLLFLSNYFESFGLLGALAIYLSSLWSTQCKNLPAPSWPMEEIPQVLPDRLLFQGHWGVRVLQDLPSGSLEMLQPSACHQTLNMVPAHLEGW